MKKNLFIITVAALVLFTGCNTGSQSGTMENDYSKIIAARIYIAPEHIDEFRELFRELIHFTLQEPGCTGYELFQDPYDPTRFLVFETFVDQAAVEAHFAAPYFAEYGEKIGRLAYKPAEIVVYDVAGEVRP
jgi:quinol monooxygenase YgiN